MICKVANLLSRAASATLPAFLLLILGHNGMVAQAGEIDIWAQNDRAYSAKVRLIGMQPGKGEMNANMMQMSLALFKGEFRLGEPMWCDIGIRNGKGMAQTLPGESPEIEVAIADETKTNVHTVSLFQNDSSTKEGNRLTPLTSTFTNGPTIPGWFTCNLLVDLKTAFPYEAGKKYKLSACLKGKSGLLLKPATGSFMMAADVYAATRQTLVTNIGGMKIFVSLTNSEVKIGNIGLSVALFHPIPGGNVLLLDDSSGYNMKDYKQHIPETIVTNLQKQAECPREIPVVGTTKPQRLGYLSTRSWCFDIGRWHHISEPGKYSIVLKGRVPSLLQKGKEIDYQLQPILIKVSE